MAIDPAKSALDVGLIVSDIRDSLDFYVDFLDLTFLGEVDLPFGKLYRLAFGASFLKLIVPNSRPRVERSSLTEMSGFRYITFQVNNITAMHEMVKDRGTPFELALQELLPGLLVMMIRDPDGNIVELIERK
jgi:catechol 2,3-dioxygenase-like lactoylglutathione lyase family enzyme